MDLEVIRDISSHDQPLVCVVRSEYHSDLLPSLRTMLHSRHFPCVRNAHFLLIPPDNRSRRGLDRAISAHSMALLCSGYNVVAHVRLAARPSKGLVGRSGGCYNARAAGALLCNARQGAARVWPLHGLGMALRRTLYLSIYLSMVSTHVSPLDAACGVLFSRNVTSALCRA